ncbi:hypothetical protein E0Z10_g7495 [Xylaria hypoxylon]|uniref:Uncharacterized protein n=1 Tax=Xylaria hypoxylon TaxID=37992 RepID=A0A4Z0YXZ8_9PEZI|nr:hypothetical protein E0Z10_g7495 [Xylaria hypoxylon]
MASFGSGGASNFVDPSTGQMSRQWQVAVPSAMPKPWSRVDRPIYTDYHQLEIPYGAASLVDMCLRVTVQHIDELDQAHLQNLPIRFEVVGRIWEYVKRTKVLSVETWKLLATTITKDEEMEHYVCPLLMNHSISISKTQPLAAYIEPLVSNTFDFLTHLTIAGQAYGRTPELLQLIQLKNLAVLEIIDLSDENDVFPQLTDSIMREWSTTPDPFPLLRILRVWGNDHTTRRSLRYLHAFPSLVLYDIAGRKRDWAEKDEEYVWESNRKTWTTHLEDTLLGHFHLVEASSSCYDRKKLKPHRATNMKIAKIKPIPLQRDNKKACESPMEYDDDLSLRSVFAAWCPWGWHHGDGYSPYYGLSEFPDRGNFWGFLMYCHIGKLLSDQDLRAQGLEIGKRALGLEDFVLPPRPMINLVLGEEISNLMPPLDNILSCNDARSRNEWGRNNNIHIGKYFETQLTFIRRGNHEEKQEASGSTTVGREAVKRSLDASTATSIPLKKRRDISSLLESFN